MIEVKNANHTISKNLYYFREKYKIEAIQVVKELKREKIQNNIKVMKGINFLKSLEL